MTPARSQQGSELRPQDVAQATMPSVVVLTMRDASGQPSSLGSGFVVAPNVVATNYHVIIGASGGSGKRLGAEESAPLVGVVASDPEHDVALVEMATAQRPLKLRTTTRFTIGERLFAIGNPEGLEGTFSEGILSAIRPLGKDTILQLTAPISPGSSGGPVLDSRGEVIGVATATFREGQNLNFAVPSIHLERLLARRSAPLSFSDASPRKQSGFAERFGERNTSGVAGENFQWEGEFDFQSGYTFSLRNKLAEPIQEVICLVVFYDREGNPLESDLVQSVGLLGPGLAQRVHSRVDPSVKRITTNKSGYLQYSFKPSTRVEFRILNFRIVR
ncbi:MAG: S1C family serine protease [Gemmatimonadetes bacterium]|nr:S1C family serine protease [Gemmatimonadota bacterium]